MTEYTKEEILDKDFDLKDFVAVYGYKHEKVQGFPLEFVPGEGLYKRSSYLDAQQKTKTYLANMNEDVRIHTIGAIGDGLNGSSFFRYFVKYPLVLFAGVAIGFCSKSCSNHSDAPVKASTITVQHPKVK